MRANHQLATISTASRRSRVQQPHACYSLLPEQACDKRTATTLYTGWKPLKYCNEVARLGYLKMHMHVHVSSSEWRHFAHTVASYPCRCEWLSDWVVHEKTKRLLIRMQWSCTDTASLYTYTARPHFKTFCFRIYRSCEVYMLLTEHNIYWQP